MSSIDVSLVEPPGRGISATCLKVSFTSKKALLNAYLQYVQNGGLFIPSETEFNLGELLQVELTLPDTSTPCKVWGKVVLFTPSSAAARWTPGVGIEFEQSEAAKRLCEIINQLIANIAATDRCVNIV